MTDSVLVGTDDARMDFALSPTAVPLDTVRTQDVAKKYISPHLAGFEERSHLHQGGHFVSDSTLRANEGKRLGDVLLSRMPGMELFRPIDNPSVPPEGEFAYTGRTGGKRGGEECGVFMRCQVGYDPLKFPDLCYVSVYLDGILVYDPAHMKGNPPDINSMEVVSDLAGVEFYSSSASTPAEFGQNPCGTLVLWTREK